MLLDTVRVKEEDNGSPYKVQKAYQTRISFEPIDTVEHLRVAAGRENYVFPVSDGRIYMGQPLSNDYIPPEYHYLFAERGRTIEGVYANTITCHEDDNALRTLWLIIGKTDRDRMNIVDIPL